MPTIDALIATGSPDQVISAEELFELALDASETKIAVASEVITVIADRLDDKDEEAELVDDHIRNVLNLPREQRYTSPTDSIDEIKTRAAMMLLEAQSDDKEGSIWDIVLSILRTLKLALSVMLRLVRMFSRMIVGVARMALRLAYAAGRFVVMNVLRPVLVGMLSFVLANPLGAALIVAAGGASYLLYRVFRGEDQGDVELDGETTPGSIDISSGQIEDSYLDSILGVRRRTKGRTMADDEPIRVQKSGAKPGNAAEAENAIVALMDSSGMTSPEERAMFMAQLSHESGGFRYAEEIWGPTPAQRSYEGRKNLGNTQPGDGYRFRGRGYIQLTGRANYEQAGAYLGIDLVNNPDMASEPDVAAATALWYWRVARPKIPGMARAGDIKGVTQAINGGYNGLADRVSRYQRYLEKTKAGGEQGYKASIKTMPEEVTSAVAANQPQVGDSITSTPKPKPVQAPAPAPDSSASGTLPNSTAMPVVIKGKLMFADAA